MIKITGHAKLIFDSLYDGILIIDKEGIVRYINPAYTRITKVEEKNIIGRYLSEVRPGSRLTNVVKNEKMELGAHRKMGEVEYLVNMVPIYEEGKVIGGISLLNELVDIYKLTEKLNLSKIIIQNLKEHVKTLGNGKYSFDDIIAVDEKSVEVKDFAKRIALADSNVLITGESGTGKELYASAIHNLSPRKDFPFIPVNCASFEKNLIESELFGYEEGAFTGAKKNGKTGLFQLAQGGTLFLDEIGELEYGLQGKLLRVLQEKSVRKIGGSKEIPIDVRLICATNKNLEKMIQDNTFRRDLYYRIAIMPLSILPLREKKNDIKSIAEKFLLDLSIKYKKEVKLNENALKVLKEYDWPGNIRELKNIIEFTFNMVEGNEIKAEHLPIAIKKNLKENDNISPLSEVVKEAEKSYLKKVIEIYGDSVEGKKKAAKALEISLATLYNKLEK
ncbi:MULTISPECIES: sigma-54 interaction domain-containing protein [Fusobacterium]|uniref:sigma-54 interaction domain-containing protein n=1 Tax=Fusobacterium TaxID=848 RepID=UPI000E413203|nr:MULTISPECIES: sigma 54-interacting transcriptional regulator [Fusobacterium]MCD7979373.1 sigma 54-interacting transcriptional regulator [Fusobacterium sp.]MCF0170215.1 sigma 54-interacting transcriptional regulator [Fusobacterium varium]MCF2673021.1 sigma 54-interacting transcriptional regulator [Fusobacterium varium]MCI6032246.1 sigma 54-interacting transcriptional regulator [Fusobacterium varium]MDY4006771.1 sigma 54-interacting transcriptional regulator [Fusobacterium varium]